MEELVDSLKIAFANSFVFHLKAWGYHWNVEGEDFYQYHEMLGKIYEEVQDSLDETAEHIRQLESYAPFSMERIKQLSEIAEDLKIPSTAGMASELIQANEIVLQRLSRTFELSEANGQYGLSDFVAGRIAAHKKHAWFLRSSIKKR
ncbi:MAG: Dps family protein [Flavobacteriales bacterium]